jgi:Protein of unknown function (DUF3034)
MWRTMGSRNNVSCGCLPLAGLLIALAGATPQRARADGERPLGTGGVTQLEGSGGGGLVPWALITGLETNTRIGFSADCTYVRPQHFSLTSCGAALGIRNRVEISYARQTFDLDDVAPGRSIRQDTVGFKIRLRGDAVFDQDSPWPQLAAGVQFKKNEDFAFMPQRLGARSDHGADVYLAATKAFLAGPFAHTLLLDATVRASRANQFGILGFGGDRDSRYRLLPEASAAIFVTDSLIAGAEYRGKPDNLATFRENAAHDLFVTWFPLRHCAITGAYVHLGNIATHPDENGWYLALQGSL